MFGNAATECTLYMAANMGNFSLDSAEAERRLVRFLRTDSAATARIIDAYRSAMGTATPSQIMAAVTTDYTYRRNTTREAALQSAAARAPVYTYVFDWRTPVRGGVLQSPHTSEVPFVFGTAPAAEALLGTGTDIVPLTQMMIASWSAFAHTGNPANPHLPTWPRYEATKRSTMLLSRESTVAGNPGGQPAGGTRCPATLRIQHAGELPPSVTGETSAKRRRRAGGEEHQLPGVGGRSVLNRNRRQRNRLRPNRGRPDRVLPAVSRAERRLRSVGRDAVRPAHVGPGRVND
jgi:hypothetical protein